MGYCINHQDKQLLQAVHAAIVAGPGKRWTQAALCRQTGMNKVKFCKGFQLLYGVSPFAFLAEQRMQLAKGLLTGTDKPIKEIAWLAGYQSVKSFHRAFRHRFRCTPLSVRVAVA